MTVLTPGREDLAAMGVNPMDARRREAVLDTSLRTSPASLARSRAWPRLPGDHPTAHADWARIPPR